VKAVDTNVVVRFITRDDPDQSQQAAECVAQGVFVSESVLMETEWVLRSVARWERERVNDALSIFLAVESVASARPEDLAWALDRHRDGADWADMLHLIAARGHDAFVSFDSKLPNQIGSAPPVPVQILK
jgi:predicted nucleic-acid-binding protein